MCAGSASALESVDVRIMIESPLPGESVSNKVHQAPIRGSAIAEGDRPADFDVILVVDVSGSTKVASGVDVDRDGDVGFDPQMELVPPGTYPPTLRNTDPADSILAAEIAAAEALLTTLDANRVRVGVISFSGEMNPATGNRVRFDQQDAWVEVPLTTTTTAGAARAPRGILARGPHGGTNFAAGVRMAVTELANLSGSRSAPRDGAKKVVLFPTDGLPTFPIGSGSSADPG